MWYRLTTAWLAVIVLMFQCGCGTSEHSYFTDTKSTANVYTSHTDGDINKVAIMPFKAPTELIGASVSDLFVTEMLRAGRYTLVERGQMAQVLSESELALSGLSASQAVEVGSMLGAEGVVIGTVSEYGTVAYKKHPYPVVGISVRMINVKNGRVVWSVDHSARARDKSATLSEHARGIVHEMMAGLYKKWGKRRY